MKLTYVAIAAAAVAAVSLAILLTRGGQPSPKSEPACALTVTYVTNPGEPPPTGGLEGAVHLKTPFAERRARPADDKARRTSTLKARLENADGPALPRFPEVPPRS